MTNENANTADLTMDEKLDRVLARLSDLDTRLAAMDTRLATLEAQAEDRARETRPKLDLIIAGLASLGEGQKDAARRLDRIESRLETLALDVVDVRADQRRLTGRMDDLERRPN